MADSVTSDRRSTFLGTGIYRFEGSNTVFIDPVRVLNRSYTRFRVSPSAYYSRFFQSKSPTGDSRVPNNSRKRKRKEKKTHTLNLREQAADERHQKVKALLLEAHGSFLGARDLLALMETLSGGDEFSGKEWLQNVEQSFVEHGSVWQAPLYEITLNYNQDDKPTHDGGSPCVNYSEQRVLPVFSNLVVNEAGSDVEAELLNNKYIIPKESGFFMSDLGQIHNLIPAVSDCGFNLIVIDPPWENSSAYQKMKYPTLPNRYLLSLPLKQFVHAKGALVALWVTNREKLRVFVEKELFPAWGVKYEATLYWLKVKADGSLISELDLFHHRPYECLLIGYCDGDIAYSKCLSRLRPVLHDQVFISVPGDYSRKPPVGELLWEYAPGPKPPRCLELFAREMIAGWTSWGNEPLRFQDSRYFLRGEMNNASK
ncbi:hypothetical protein RJ640_021022 [Escallonia rubra]|uniref:Methyltransferase-like protein 2 n=1 Tax=Escallonia rubra TaxID=112253 RepID=A0AA88S364_9ASTE|nr:hypothetical protein RJ640_021022 [Escallonia rubra]